MVRSCIQLVFGFTCSLMLMFLQANTGEIEGFWAPVRSFQSDFKRGLFAFGTYHQNPRSFEED